jgi:DNA-directed RNA polymerase subunit M/transcription elongation factor TFIIS
MSDDEENGGDRSCPRCRSEMLPVKEKKGKWYFCHRCGYDVSLEIYLRDYAPDIRLPKEYCD